MDNKLSLVEGLKEVSKLVAPYYKDIDPIEYIKELRSEWDDKAAPM